MKIHSLVTFMLAAGLLLVLALSPVHANGITVNTAGDSNTADGFCSLREAIVAANTDAAYNGCTTGSGADTISFAGDYTITLNGSRLPAITSTLTINGNGPANTIIRAHASPNIVDYSVIQVNAAGNLTLDSVTVKNGSTIAGGGGIYNSEGTLTLTNSTLSGNSSTFLGGGGGIYNEGGTVTVANSTISDNSAAGGGGGIYNEGGTVTVANSTISGNSATTGAGIYSFEGVMIMTNNTVSGNSATTGGGIYNSGEQFFSPASTMSMTNNTVSGNSATTGGGVFNEGVLHLAGNIFAVGLRGNNCVNNGDGTLNDNGYNLSSDTTCVTSGPGSQANATLDLGVLADNGGPTPTHLPGVGSDAIGAIPLWYALSNNGVPLACNSTITDQIGNSRPINTGAACTSGAVEVVPLSNSLTLIKDAHPGIGTDFDFTINSAPLTSYSGSTMNAPFWTRPNQGTNCTLSANSVRYHVQSFVVDTSGYYTLSSQQNYNGYIHLYQDSLNLLDQCANYLNGDDDGLTINRSEIINQYLEAGRVYLLVTSGFGSANAGPFSNSIADGGTAYTLNTSFALDDAVPDDNDGVDASITYYVEPGTYTIAETLPNSDWVLDSASCTGASGGDSLTGETLSVTVGSDETVVCTFTNQSVVDCANISTESQLALCISEANENGTELDILILGADLTLTSTLPQITTPITLEGASHTIDGGNSVQIFNVGSTGNLTVNQATLQKGGGAEPYGGAVENSGILRVTNSTFSGNATTVGGAICNYADGTLTVANSTFSGNSGVYGGGIWNGGTLTVISSTFSGNLGVYRGGAMLNEGTAHLAANIFAAGTSGANCMSGDGTLYDNGYNLSDDDTCGFDASGATGSADNATLNLGELVDNGGPTPTHLPGLSSDAIGAIPNGTIISNHGTGWTCNDVDTFTDQRGESRPIISGDGCTVGAVEVGVTIFHDGFE